MAPASPADSRIRASVPPAPVTLPPPTVPQRDVAVERPGSWPRSAQWATAVLLGVVLLLLGIQVGKGSRDNTTSDVPDLLVDLNTATRAELLQIPGVGPALADRIVAYRRTSGAFREVDDVRRVPGIGPATLQRLRAYVYVEPPPANAIAVTAPAHQGAADKPANPRKSREEEALAGQVINVNRAGLEELQKLPGIGPKLSRRIIDERGKRPFASIDELRRVYGIGPKTLDKIRPYVTVDDRNAAVASIE